MLIITTICVAAESQGRSTLLSIVVTRRAMDSDYADFANRGVAWGNAKVEMHLHGLRVYAINVYTIMRIVVFNGK